METVVDVLVVGAGPGGMQAAIAAASEGLSVLVLEKSTPGGQIGQTPRLENSVFAGGSVTGPQFARMMREQCEEMGARIETAEVYQLIASGPGKPKFVFPLPLDQRRIIEARVVVIACGNKWTQMEIAGLPHALNKSCYYGPVKAIDYYANGRDVAVYGGGPSAGQAILALADSKSAGRVHALMRSTLKMPQYLVDRIKGHPKIELHEYARINRIQYHSNFESTDIFFEHAGYSRKLPVAALFLCNGLVPDTAWLKGTLPLTDYGQVKVEGNVRTNIPGVYAIGDCREGSTPRVGAAIGDGSLAITEAWRYFKQYPVHSRAQEIKL